MKYIIFGMILVLVLSVGCQGQETNSQRIMGNEVLITAVSPTETPATSNSQPATALAEPVEAEPVEVPTTANADVTFVRAIKTGSDTWIFHVTVDHPDTGWEDYADGWDVVLPDGTIIKPDETSPFTRLLTHPHETERPFTRSQSNIIIPASITSVTVRAHDLVDGFGGKEVVVNLTAVSGPNFEVEQ